MKHQRSPKNKRQEGVVIVVALFIVALVATMSYIMLYRLERDTARTTMILRDAKAENLAQGSISWAMDQLYNNLKNQKPDKIVDVIPSRSPTQNVDGYEITTTIYDAQARYNINRLITKTAQDNFLKFLQWAQPKLSLQDAQNLIKAMADWVNFESKDTTFTKFYLESKPPYQVAHRPMISTSELYFVKGMTKAIYTAIKPYIIALPGDSPINIQTAEAPVLMTLSPNISYATANAIREEKAALVSVQKFAELDIVRNNKISADMITAISNFFLVESVVSIEKQRLVLYTLLERKQQDQKTIIRIVWQSKGIW